MGEGAGGVGGLSGSACRGFGICPRSFERSGGSHACQGRAEVTQRAIRALADSGPQQLPRRTNCFDVALLRALAAANGWRYLVTAELPMHGSSRCFVDPVPAVRA